MPLEIDDFKPFTQRTLSAKFPDLDLEVSGKVEFVIARGKQRPKQPYFFTMSGSPPGTSKNAAVRMTLWDNY